MTVGMKGRLMILGALALVSVGLIGFRGKGTATDEDARAIMHRSVTFLRANGDLPPGRVLIDPRVKDGYDLESKWKGDHPPARFRHALDSAGASVGSLRGRTRCYEGNRCEIAGAAAYVAFGEPEVSGDLAEIVVQIVRPETTGQGLFSSRTARFGLSKVGGAWKVDSVEELAVT